MPAKDSGETVEPPFIERLKADWPPANWINSNVIVAVSGGPDSTALLHGISQLQPDRERLFVAHFNHQLRGEASQADQHFVEDCCRKLQIQCLVERADPTEFEQHRSGEGIESAARQLRYRFLTKTAKKLGARFIATGHTADDRLETVLHHILRGTGLAGLAGIPRIRVLHEAVTLIRPLLSMRRSEILEYLSDLGQDSRLDETNLQTCLTRNRIRLNLLPQLEQEFNPEVRSALLRLAQIAEEAQSTLHQIAADLLDAATEENVPEEITLNTSHFESISDHLRRECFVCLWQRQGWPLQSMQFRHWQQLADISHSTGSTRFCQLPGGISGQRTGNSLRLAARG
ncbi:MAG: tRNA lysidine(34) synthetase TilS [Planctomycetaceae bacterium]|nr:tRNA lysidine(34) synthetase TilS [Planctomycetaceae bacterium]